MRLLTALALVALWLCPSFARAEPTAVFVLLGGYDSCYQTSGSDPWPKHTLIWKQFESKLMPAVQGQTGTAPKFIAGCYGVAPRTFLDYYVDFRFLTSVDADVRDVYASRFFAENAYQDYSDTVNDVVAAVEAAVQGLSDPRVYFIGHSYGGWTSLQSVMELLNHGKPVRAVYTIDPVSPIGCNPLSYVQNIPMPPSGCRQAPADITPEQRALLVAKLEGRWLNFYETQHFYLHSGPISELEADGHDFRVEVPSAIPVFTDQHLRISADPRVWNRIETETLSDLAD